MASDTKSTKKGVNFQEFIVECCQNDDFVREFNRLFNTTLNFHDKRKPIEIMVDKATGYNNPFRNKPEEIQQFITFIFQYIWLPAKLEDMALENDR